ncbi:MAG: hypothetical protein JXR73_10235 [Candidatus Omnitrophica bacterium]|nr:hypothetical protein [Candidatus Omnitrophota bacterium]
MDEREIFEFRCRCSGRPFQISAPAPSRGKHLALGAATLGTWLFMYAIYRLGRLYWISKCPQCRKRSRSVFWALVIVLLLSVEFGRTMYYFLISAPQQIVADMSFTDLPDDLDLNAPLAAKDLKSAIGFVWVIAALPAAGMFISTYWPYLILAWASAITLFGLILPSYYRKP